MKAAVQKLLRRIAVFAETTGRKEEIIRGLLGMVAHPVIVHHLSAGTKKGTETAMQRITRGITIKKAKHGEALMAHNTNDAADA
jgi:hypothetical protein